MVQESGIKTVGSSGKLGEKVKFFATIIGIASPVLALGTFIGLKPEKKKSLEWEYISQSSLVNTSAATGDKIEVFYEGRKIKQLTAVSARLSNNGSLPVDNADVKDNAFPTVTFPQSVSVIGAEIKDRTPADLKASVSITTNRVRIEHGLLNPSDNLSLQILLEGEPGPLTLLPRVSYRISGITSPATRYPAPPKPQARVTYFHFGSGAEYTILISSTLFALLIEAGLIVAGFTEIRNKAFPERRLEEAVSNLLSAPSTSGEGAASEPFRQQVAREFWIRLSKPHDKRSRDAVNKLEPKPAESPRDFLDRAKEHVQETVLPHGFRARWAAIEKSTIFAYVVLLCLGVALGLVMAGAWHRLISGS